MSNEITQEFTNLEIKLTVFGDAQVTVEHLNAWKDLLTQELKAWEAKMGQVRKVTDELVESSRRTNFIFLPKVVSFI